MILKVGQVLRPLRLPGSYIVFLRLLHNLQTSHSCRSFRGCNPPTMSNQSLKLMLQREHAPKPALPFNLFLLALHFKPPNHNNYYFFHPTLYNYRIKKLAVQVYILRTPVHQPFTGWMVVDQMGGGSMHPHRTKSQMLNMAHERNTFFPLLFLYSYFSQFKFAYHNNYQVILVQLPKQNQLTCK